MCVKWQPPISSRGAQRSHVAQDRRRILFNHVRVRLKAQAKIVIAPHANGIRLSQESASLFNPVALLKQIANYDDLIDALALEAIESRLQMSDVFVNVREQSEFHLMGLHPASFGFRSPSPTNCLTLGLEQIE